MADQKLTDRSELEALADDLDYIHVVDVSDTTDDITGTSKKWKILTHIKTLKLSDFASTTSSELAGIISGKTGSGDLVFADTPTLVTPNIGEASGVSLQLSGLTASRILIADASKNIISVDTATYPSLTELSYVKGVTSAIQTQLGNKLSNIVEDTTPQLGGDLDANTHKITGLVDPTADQEAATKKYVDDSIIPLSDEGLVLYLPFDENTGTTAGDKSHYGNNGTLNGFTGTADSGSTTTLVDSILSDTDDTYNGLELYITGGTNSGEHRTISDYVGSTHTITVDTAFTSAIDNTSEYIIGWSEGHKNVGLKFDGANDYVDLGYPDTLNFTHATSYTISIWVYLEAIGSESKNQGIIAHTYRHGLAVSDVNRRIQFGMRSATSADYVKISTATVPLQEWTHLLVTHDASTKKITLYKNGVEVDSITHNLSDVARYQSFTWTIGKFVLTGNWKTFNGKIDEVRIYNRVLLANEVRMLYLRN